MANLHPTGKRGVNDAIPAQPMGRKQESILQSLREHTYWSANCGWIFGTHARTVKLLESLIPRGLVVRTEETTGHTGVVASLYGRTRTVYRPTYGARKAPGAPQEAAKAPALPQGADTPPVTLTEWERMLLRNLVREHARQYAVAQNSDTDPLCHVRLQEFEALARKLGE